MRQCSALGGSTDLMALASKGMQIATTQMSLGLKRGGGFLAPHPCSPHMGLKVTLGQSRVCPFLSAMASGWGVAVGGDAGCACATVMPNAKSNDMGLQGVGC